MQQVVKLENELDELKKVPQYIYLFCKVMKQKLGGNREQVEEAIQVAQAYYKESEYPNVYGKLLVLEMEYHLLYGMLSEAVELGERALLFCKEHQAIHEMIQIENQLLRAYMEKGLFEKALCKRRVPCTCQLKLITQYFPIYLLIQHHIGMWISYKAHTACRSRQINCLYNRFISSYTLKKNIWSFSICVL